MRVAWVLLAAFVAAGAPVPVSACDSTGCLMLTRGPGGVLRKGGFNVELSYRYADQSKLMIGSEETNFVSRPRVDVLRGRLISNYHRDIDGVDRGFQAEAAYGVGARTTLFASAPVLSLKSHEIGHAALVTQYDTWGFGDTVVGARQALTLPFAGSAMASLAIKMPTGKTSLIDRFDSMPLDPMLQPGTGSWDVLFSGQYTRSFDTPRLDVTLSGSYQANTTNDHKYRFGNEAIASLALSRPLGKLFAVSAQAKWMHEGRDRFVGVTVPSTGSQYVYLTAGLRVFHGAFSYYAVLQAPLYRYVNEAQLAPTTGLVAGLSRSF